MPDSFIPYGADPGTVGRRQATAKRSMTRDAVTTDFHHDEVVVVDRRVVTYRGAVGTFRTPGRAGTVGQKIAAIHNATGSTVLVDVTSMNVSIVDTVAKLVLPPIVRAWRFTAVPTNGTALAKRGQDTAQTSNASVTLWGDASADGTGSATTLTITLPAAQFLSQAPASRALTLVGVEPDRDIYLLTTIKPVVLQAGEGLAVHLDYPLATANPTTDMWMVDFAWDEYLSF